MFHNHNIFLINSCAFVSGELLQDEDDEEYDEDDENSAEDDIEDEEDKTEEIEYQKMNCKD